MNTDLTTALLDARNTRTLQSATIAVIKKSSEMDKALVQMVDEAARPAPPPGQGLRVDKTA